MTPSILIAGIGNIFLGDDGFGSEVARRLAGARAWPEGVRVVDYGIRGFDVAFALMDGDDVAILVDATPQGGPPGTLYVVEPDLAGSNNPAAKELPVDTHAMNPMKVFQLVRAMDGRFNKVLIVGCEPADFGPENEGRIGLSPPVAAAVDGAVTLIDRLVAEIRNGTRFTFPALGASASAHEPLGSNSQGHRPEGQSMDITEMVEQQDPKDIVRLAGGLALITLGAGMILSFPAIRKLIHSGVEAATTDSEGKVPAAAKGMLPDIERYLKIRSM